MSEIASSETPIRVIEQATGTQRLIGYQARLYADRAEVSLDCGPDHQNRRGFVHGGILCTLLDSASGYACSVHAEPKAGAVPFVTLSLTTDFLAPIATGPIRAIARVTGGGYRTCFTTAEIVAADGTRVAQATGVFQRGKFAEGEDPHP